MVDCSHANSAKDHVRQAEVAAERLSTGHQEAFQHQAPDPALAGGELTYGQSVTDECMDFATTARLLAGLYAAMG
ncbi:hypothetical protein MAHJHV51_47290 [Mycobacterium avium subsp. hominissuis]